MVAIFGWIIPEPLQMPVIRTEPPLRATSVVTVFGTRSVVRIATANGSAVWVARSGSIGIAAAIFSMSSATPMTPVEAVKIC